jgi:hypothetical protein
MVGRRNTGKRCYDAEHVLEWQLLSMFIEEDTKTAGDNSRCVFLYKYFVNEKMPMDKHKVQSAKDNGKLTNGHFVYEETEVDFSKWNNKAQKEPRAIDWIST